MAPNLHEQQQAMSNILTLSSTLFLYPIMVILEFLTLQRRHKSMFATD